MKYIRKITEIQETKETKRKKKICCNNKDISGMIKIKKTKQIYKCIGRCFGGDKNSISYVQKKSKKYKIIFFRFFF